MNKYGFDELQSNTYELCDAVNKLDLLKSKKRHEDILKTGIMNYCEDVKFSLLDAYVNDKKNNEDEFWKSWHVFTNSLELVRSSLCEAMMNMPAKEGRSKEDNCDWRILNNCVQAYQKVNFNSCNLLY